MNKLTFERMELRHERLRKRDAVLAFEEVEFPFPSGGKKNVKSLIGEHRWALTRRKLASILLFFFYSFWFVFFFRFFFIRFVSRDTRVPRTRKPGAAKIRRDSRSRVRAYCTRIVMAIRYGLFVQKLFRACRPEKEPIYSRQICVRSRWWRPAPIRHDSCRDADKYLPSLFFFVTENKRVYIYGRSWFLPPALLSDLSIIIAHLIALRQFVVRDVP